MDGSRRSGLAGGEEIRLLPVPGGRWLYGRVLERSAGDERPGGRVRATLLPLVGAWWDGVRVWVISGDPQHAPVMVHRARLLIVPQSGEVELTEMSLLADEPRRAALRTATRCPLLLLRPGKVSSGTTSLDLSSTGCRVLVPDGQDVSAGQQVQVSVELDAGASVWADGEVVWVDDAGRVAALRFTRLDPVDQERLDRGVLTALSPGLRET